MENPVDITININSDTSDHESLQILIFTMSFRSRIAYVLKDPMFRCLALYSILYHLVKHFVNSRVTVALPFARKVMDELCYGKAWLEWEECVSLTKGHVKDFCTAEDLTLHFELKSSFFDSATIVYCFVVVCICLSMLWNRRDKGHGIHPSAFSFMSVSIFVAIGLALFTFMFLSTDSFLVFGMESDKTEQFSLFYNRLADFLDFKNYPQNEVDILTTLSKGRESKVVRYLCDLSERPYLTNVLCVVVCSLGGYFHYAILRIFILHEEEVSQEHFMTIESGDITTRSCNQFESDSGDEWEEKGDDDMLMDPPVKDPCTIGELV